MLQGTELDFRIRGSTMILACLLSALASQLPFRDPITGQTSVIFLHSPIGRLCSLVGFAVCALGVFIRMWATGYLPHEIIENRKLHAPKLVTEGAYSVVRNPLYLGTFLITTSWACDSRSIDERKTARTMDHEKMAASLLFFVIGFFTQSLVAIFGGMALLITLQLLTRRKDAVL